MRRNSQKHTSNPDFLQWTMPRLLGAGYGLFSRRAISPRWPEFLITAAVIRKYRKRRSFWFMVRSASSGVTRHAHASREAQALFATLIGSTPRQLQQLAGIYDAMRIEQGTAVAMATVVEIVRITNEKRKHGYAWWRKMKKSIAGSGNQSSQRLAGSKSNKKR